MWWEYKTKLIDSHQILISLSEKDIRIQDPHGTELNISLFFPQLAHILHCLLTSSKVEVI